MADADAIPHSIERMQRSERQIAEQHSALDRLQVDLQRALEDGADRDVEAALRALEGAVVAHFELEEHAYYPDPAGLPADTAEALRALEGEHEQLRAELEDLRRAYEGEGLPALRTAFSIFATALAEHETREEKLMERLSHPD
jgi:hypothetical protein